MVHGESVNNNNVLCVLCYIQYSYCFNTYVGRVVALLRGGVGGALRRRDGAAAGLAVGCGCVVASSSSLQSSSSRLRNAYYYDINYQQHTHGISSLFNNLDWPMAPLIRAPIRRADARCCADVLEGV